jgi:hypothetical protein
MEIIMQTEVIWSKEFDGTHWHVTLCGHKIGPPCTKVECDDHLKWFMNGGTQGFIDVLEIILDKWFKEKENGK